MKPGNSEDDLPVGVTLNILLFLEGQSQLSPKDEVHIRRIASVLIYVERAIQRKIIYNLIAVFQLYMNPDFN